MHIDIGTIIGIVGIIFGLATSFFFYQKGKKKKKLVYNLETTILISESLKKYENLRILYNYDDIKSLNSTNIKIRNVGNDIIEPDDFMPATPIIIKTSGNFLLEDVTKYEISCTNSKNRINLEKVDESHLKVVFDFLNPKDEIQITILHTGNISITGELKQGEVKNYSNKKYEKNETLSNQNYEDNNHYNHYDSRYLFYKIIPMMFILFTMFTTILLIYELLNNLY